MTKLQSVFGSSFCLILVFKIVFCDQTLHQFFKSWIPSNLGLTFSQKRVTGSVPDFMKELYSSSQNRQDCHHSSEHHGNTVRSLHGHALFSYELQPDTVREIRYFVPPTLVNENLTKAELRFSSASHLRIKQIIINNRNCSFRNVIGFSNAYDITQDIQVFLKRNATVFDFKFVFDVENYADVNHDVGNYADVNLVLVSSDANQCSQRHKRSIPAEFRDQVNPICRVKPLTIHFKELGWGKWVVAPKSFPANQCEGTCPYPLADNLNTTNHAILQTLVHAIDSDAIPEVCCAPTELSSLSILFFDDRNDVVLKKYDNMVVEACGCL